MGTGTIHIGIVFSIHSMIWNENNMPAQAGYYRFWNNTKTCHDKN